MKQGHPSGSWERNALRSMRSSPDATHRRRVNQTDAMRRTAGEVRSTFTHRLLHSLFMRNRYLELQRNRFHK
jgi:hypothetical protein